jgi:hypothetical protein
MDDLTPEVPKESPDKELKLFPSLKGVVVHPKVFFETMPLEGSYRQPLLFAAVVGIISVTAHGLTHGIPQWRLPVQFFFYIVGMYGTAGLYWVIARLVGGKGSYQGTFRAVVYSSVASLLTWIPYVGFPASVYQLVLSFLGIRRAQGLSDKRTLIVVGPLYLFCALVTLLFHS